MRIVVDALSARLGGGQTYLINLFQALPALKDSEFLVVAPQSLPLPADRSDVRRLPVRWPVLNPALRAIWQHGLAPALTQFGDTPASLESAWRADLGTRITAAPSRARDDIRALGCEARSSKDLVLEPTF